MVRAILFLLVVLVDPADAVTIAVGSETYLVGTMPMPTVSDTSPLPLDIAASTNNVTIWMVPEFDKRIYSVPRAAAANTTMTQVDIQAPTSPLFRNTVGGADAPSFFSAQQEKIATTSDGSVWVSQGGNIFYGGSGNDWSRIMHRKPDGSWEAYTLPVDNAGAVGFAVTDPQAHLWVASSGDNALIYCRTRAWHDAELSPTRYPPVDNRWEKLRNFGASFKPKFPAQVIRLKDKRIAGTLYFDNAFYIYNPDTLEYARIALTAIPSPCTRCALSSSGPWQILQDVNENLWIAEDYAQRVTKYNLFTGAQTVFDLSTSLSSDEGPHSLALDAAGTGVFVTTYSISAGGDGRLVSITSAGTISIGASFATIGLAGGLTGIVRTTSTELWVALFRQLKVARLTKQ